MESHGKSWKAMEGQGRSRKVACRIILSAPVPVPFLWTLDFGLGLGFGPWIWDLDLEPGFGTGLGLDNSRLVEMNCQFS